MQDGIFQGNHPQDQISRGEERARGMHDVGYSFQAQSEDDAYLLPVTRKPRNSLVEAFMGLARRLSRH